MNMFERASRVKLRFLSAKGALTVENLWDLPLQSTTGMDLDTLAKATNATLKSASEESFVTISSNPLKEESELKLDILKHILISKQAEQADRVNAAQRAERKRKLLNILADKEDDSLKQMTPEQIREAINNL